LGYEEIAIRIVALKKDESGRSILVELQRAGPPGIQANASDALKSLDEAKKLVNIAEFGKPELDETFLNEHPELRAPFTQGETWSQTTAQELGISSKLGVAILYDTAVQNGVGRAR
jgi:hypothetical protein